MKKLLISCAVLMIAIVPAFAADTAAPAAAPAASASSDAAAIKKSPRQGVFEQADANHDGQVTKQEFMDQESKYFDEVDANHDGILSQDEIAAHRKAGFEKWKAKHDAKDAAPAAASGTQK